MDNNKNYKFKADCANGSVKIGELQTGKNWLNMLWNELGYQLAVTHTGATTSAAVTNSGSIIRLNADLSTLVYVRDESGKYFNAGGYPCGVIPRNYSCTHAQCYSTVKGCKFNLAVEHTVAVCPDELCELHKVTVTNRARRAKKVDLFFATLFDLGGYAMPFYYNAPTTSATEYMPESNAVICLSQNPYGDMKHKSGFVAASVKPDYVCGNWGDFIGVCGSSGSPRVLSEGKHLGGGMATVRDRCGITEHCLTLDAGQSITVYFTLGFAVDKADASRVIKRVLCDAPSLFENLPALSGAANGELSTATKYTQINTVLNRWAAKQVKFCCIGKKAVRDNAQLAAALLNFDPEAAKHTLAECLAHQYRDGHAMLLWYPVIETRVYSDPAFWLITAVAEYIKETGDKSFLDERVPFYDGGDGTVLQHIEAGVRWYCDDCNFGADGLPKIYTADWNDALNIPDEGAQSVLAGEFVCYLYGEMSEFYENLGQREKARDMAERKQKLADVINKVAYNGEYYIRAISKFGRVGDRGCEGGEFYFNTQSWAALADIIPPQRVEQIIKATDKYETDLGVPMCVPPYPRYDERVGRMSGMLPGVYENGGIYNHAGCFKVMADCKLGLGERALKTLLKILPNSAVNPSSQSDLEPYVFSNCYLMHPSVKGKVASSWQTGTSAWGLRCYYEGILGLNRTYSGLKIKPCLARDCGIITATRTYRGAKLNITYRDCGDCKSVKVYLNGKLMPDNVISPDGLREGGEYTVLVTAKGESD